MGEAQHAAWEKLNNEGKKAFEQGHDSEAERLFLAAVKEVEKFGNQDNRLATSLGNLAVLYGDQGKYAEAESLRPGGRELGRERRDEV